MKILSILLLPTTCLLIACSSVLGGTADTFDKTTRSTVTTDDSLLQEFFRPALNLRYTYDDGMNFTDFNGEFSMHEAEITVPLSPVQRSQFYLLSYLYYRYYQMDVDTLGLSGEFDLHTLRVPIQAAWLSADSPWFVYVFAEPGVSSDSDTINRDSFDISASVDVGYRFSSRLVLAIGVYYTRDYGDDLLLPSIGLLWAPNDLFSLNITPEGVISTFKYSDDWRIKLKAIPYGGRWIVDNNNGRERIELMGAKVGVDIEHRFYKQAWLSVGAGANVFSNLHVDDANGREVLNCDLEPGLYVTAGLHWTF